MSIVGVSSAQCHILVGCNFRSERLSLQQGRLSTSSRRWRGTRRGRGCSPERPSTLCEHRRRRNRTLFDATALINQLRYGARIREDGQQPVRSLRVLLVLVCPPSFFAIGNIGREWVHPDRHSPADLGRVDWWAHHRGRCLACNGANQPRCQTVGRQDGRVHMARWSVQCVAEP